MIGNLRKKFIFISTISIFAVFSIILSLLLVLTRVQMNRTLDMLTDTIAENNGFSRNSIPPNPILPLCFPIPTPLPKRLGSAPGSLQSGLTSSRK